MKKMLPLVQGSLTPHILGLYRDNGKENGNYYNGVIEGKGRGFINHGSTLSLLTLNPNNSSFHFSIIPLQPLDSPYVIIYPLLNPHIYIPGN